MDDVDFTGSLHFPGLGVLTHIRFMPPELRLWGKEDYT